METAGCFGKLGYDTRAKASEARSHLMRRPSFKTDAVMNVYNCTRCGKYHLGRDSRAGPNATQRTKHGERETQAKLKRYRELTSHG